MKRIGEPTLTFRLLSIVDGEVASIDPEQLKGQWVALCFVPHLGRVEIDLLDRQGRDLEELGTTLLVMSLEKNRGAAAERVPWYRQGALCARGRSFGTAPAPL